MQYISGKNIKTICGCLLLTVNSDAFVISFVNFLSTLSRRQISRSCVLPAGLLSGRFQRPHGSKTCRRTAYVAPHLISEENPMSDVNDVFNAVVVRGNATGEVMFYGKGAGELPTASACVADVIECLQEERHRPEIGWSADTGGFASPLTLKNRWYFRVGTDTLPEALHSAKVLEQGTETAFITPPITGTDAERLAAYLPTLAKMRVLD